MPAIEVLSTGDFSYIHAVVISAQKRIRIKECRCVENRAVINKKWGWEVEYSGDQIGQVWVRRAPTFRHKFVPCIVVREGANVAMSLEAINTWMQATFKTKEDLEDAQSKEMIRIISGATGLSNVKDFVPPLTQDENSKMIKHKMAQAIANQKLMTTTQFVVIVGLLAVVLIGVFLNIFGVHLIPSVGTSAINATATTHPGNFTLPTNGTNYIIP